MIAEGLLGVAALCFFGFLGMKLFDQWQLKKLRKLYPEGTETVSKPVERMGGVYRKSLSEKLADRADKLDIDEKAVIQNLKEDLLNDQPSD